MPSPVSSQIAAVLHGPRDLRLEARQLWAPGPGQCQVAIQATGLCGSDLHYYLAGRNGDFAIRSPLVLGHESAGIITALGPGVAGQYPRLRVGTRVAVECGVPCRSQNPDGSEKTGKDRCRYCSSGRYNLCKNLRFCSSAKTFPHRDGLLQEKVNHEAWCLHPIPDTLSSSLAALAEPLSVLIHASRRAGICPPPSYPSLAQSPTSHSSNGHSANGHLTNGHSTSSDSASATPLPAAGKRVLVFGVGAIGLIACALARELGAERVCAVDINPERLAFAKNNGFTYGEGEGTYCLPLPPKNANAAAPSDANPRESDNLRRAKENAATALAAFGEPDGFDVLFECTGAEGCILMSVFCANLGARVALIGMGTPVVSSFPIAAAATREVDLIGSFRYADTYKEAVEMLSRGDVSCEDEVEIGFVSKISKLITHRYPLSKTKEAFELLAKGRDENGGLVLKVLVEA